MVLVEHAVRSRLGTVEVGGHRGRYPCSMTRRLHVPVGRSQMDPVPDSFLLTLAEASETLIGLFLVGMVYYIQSGFSQMERSREVVEPYFRASRTTRSMRSRSSTDRT